MRKLVVSVLASLDGYVEGPGGDVLALPFDEGFSPHNAGLLRAADTLLMGRRGFEGFAAYWPQVADDESQPPVEREISRLNGAIEKLVVSDTLHVDPGSPWAATTRIVRRAEAADTVEALRRGDGGDILVFGSGTTWNPLLLRGLVDELRVLIGPALLGGGTKLYTGSSRLPLRLAEARVLPGSQLVLHRYTP